MAVLKLYHNISGNPENEVMIGAVCERGGKFWFNPMIQGRSPSRKQWDTPEGAIPPWARKMVDRTEDGRTAVDPYIRDNPKEHAAGLELIRLLGLKVKENGRVNTTHGDKTPVGLCRTAAGIVQ